MTPLLSIKDAARLLAISPWTVRNFLKAGKLNAVRLGRRTLLQESEIERFIEKSKNHGLKPAKEVQNNPPEVVA